MTLCASWGNAQIYGKHNVFDAERLIDLLDAFETFREASTSARGSMDLADVRAAERNVTAVTRRQDAQGSDFPSASLVPLPGFPGIPALQPPPQV